MNNYITDIEELELWKTVTIEGYEHYLVSNQGRVINSRTGHFLKPSLNKGYHRVTLSNKGVRMTNLVHRLVGLSWIPNPDNKETINHIDGIKANNHVDNLEWMTVQENMQHACDTGLIIYYRDKLLAKKEKIEEMLIQGYTYAEIAKVYDCNRSTIRRFAIDNNLRESNYTSRMALTKDQVQEAYNSLSQGESLRNLGRSLGTSGDTVRNRLNSFYGKSHIDEVMLRESNYIYRIPLTNDQIIESYKLLSEGESLSRIGRSLGVSCKIVRRRLNEFYGKSHVDEIISSSKLTIDQVQEAYNLLSQGESLRSIGRSLGFSNITVRKYLNSSYGKSHIDELMLTK